MLHFDGDAKTQAILEAAWTVFSTYGYRKTSMDDIARAARMSRPALYLHFRNKEDVFRTLTGLWYDHAEGDLRVALSGPGDVVAQLGAGFAAQCGPLMEAVLTSPHGMELMDSGAAVAADVVAAGEERLRAVYADWLAAGRAAGRMTYAGTPEDMARAFASAVKGLKMAAEDFASYKRGLAQLADLMGRGLSAA